MKTLIRAIGVVVMAGGLYLTRLSGQYLPGDRLDILLLLFGSAFVAAGGGLLFVKEWARRVAIPLLTVFSIGVLFLGLFAMTEFPDLPSRHESSPALDCITSPGVIRMLVLTCCLASITALCLRMALRNNRVASMFLHCGRRAGQDGQPRTAGGLASARLQSGGVVSMKMKRGCLITVLVGAVVLGGLLLSPVVYRRLHPIAHQRPYKWDSYVRPDLQFEMDPMTNVIAAVNAAIREASGGVMTEAIKIDPTPTRITKVHDNAQLSAHMDRLISDFREHEKEMNRRGAEGFEGAPFTGRLDGHQSLWCTLVGPNEVGLHWEPKDDALHVSRMPREMECRPYYVAPELFVRMEKQRSENRYKVGAEPIVSALIYETDIHSWSIMLPEGPNSWGGEFRYDKVFKYIPDLNVILALTTPEEHAEAEKRLKASGLWIEPGMTQEGHNNEVQPTK